uniref:Putative head-tail connector n=1 Tax=viral metagenome TaxID=1070528 RepID=A0A6M3L958_9ZZZZ
MGLVTLAKVKSAAYLNISADTYDTELQTLIDDVSNAASSYLDLDTDYTQATCPASLSDALCLQISFRWRHRETPGQQSHQYEDGSADKFGIDEFIPGVKNVLDRYRSIDIMGDR